MKTTCSCGQPVEFPDQMAGQTVACPSWQQHVLLTANISSINKTSGPAAILFYLVGLAFLVPNGLLVITSISMMAHPSSQTAGGGGFILSGFGLFIGIFFIAVGASLRRCICENCGNSVNSGSKLCPSCRATFAGK